MSEDNGAPVTLRCPVCFSRENDVTLFGDPSDLYCSKCSYTGTARQTRERYADLQKKYRWMDRRVTLEQLRQF